MKKPNKKEGDWWEFKIGLPWWYRPRVKIKRLIMTWRMHRAFKKHVFKPPLGKE